MNCFDFQQLISASLDKELTHQEEQILAEHLKSCPNCTEFSKKLEELKATTLAWKNISIPIELEKQILKSTVKTASAKKSVFSFISGYYRVPRSLAWASVLLLLILMVNSILNPVKSIVEAEKVEKLQPEIPRVQKIVLTEKDVVKTYTTSGKKNSF